MLKENMTDAIAKWRKRCSDLGNLATLDWHAEIALLNTAIEVARAAVAEAVAEEREACARMAEAQWGRHMPEDADYEWGYVDARKDIVGAIRNRARAAASAEAEEEA